MKQVTYLNKLVFVGITYAAKAFCYFYSNVEFCDKFLANVVRPMFKLAFDRLLNETVTCKKTGFCRYPLTIRADDKAFTYRVLKDKPPRKHVKVNPEDGNFTFVAFADMHVDPYYREGTEALCGTPICCRERVFSPEGNSSIPKLKAGKWGTQASCDIPLVFFSFISRKHCITLLNLQQNRLNQSFIYG